MIGLVVFMGASGEATTLDRKGPVLVNYGSGYVAADDGARLQPGDAVMAKAGGRGQIVYEDGCEDPVEPRNVVLVQVKSPCDQAGPWPLYTLPGTGVVIGSVLISDDKGIDRPASP